MHFLTPCRNYAAGVAVWPISPGGASGGLVPCRGGALYKAALLLFSTLFMASHLNPGTFQVHFPGVQGQLLTPGMPIIPKKPKLYSCACAPGRCVWGICLLLDNFKLVPFSVTPSHPSVGVLLGARHISLNALRYGHSPQNTKLPLALALSGFHPWCPNAIMYLESLPAERGS